jgi:hypothetical protein
MKRKASVLTTKPSFDGSATTLIFAAEYLKAALEDEDEPRVLLIALRHLAQAQGIAKVAGIERACIELCPTRQSSSLYARGRHQGNRAEAYRRSAP